jgi:hypothetical protein
VVETLEERRQVLRKLITQALSEQIDLWREELQEVEITLQEGKENG